MLCYCYCYDDYDHGLSLLSMLLLSLLLLCVSYYCVLARAILRVHHAADLDDVAVAIVVQDLLRLRQGDLGFVGCLCLLCVCVCVCVCLLFLISLKLLFRFLFCSGTLAVPEAARWGGALLRSLQQSENALLFSQDAERRRRD